MGNHKNVQLFVSANSRSHGGNSIHFNMQKLWTQIAGALTENQKGEEIKVSLNLVVDARWTKRSISTLTIFRFSYTQSSLEFTENGERKLEAVWQSMLCGCQGVTGQTGQSFIVLYAGCTPKQTRAGTLSVTLNVH